jgi:hypothetical protein
VIEAIGAKRIPTYQDDVDAIYALFIDRRHKRKTLIPAFEVLVFYWKPPQTAVDKLYQYAVRSMDSDLIDCLIQNRYVPTSDAAEDAVKMVLMNAIDLALFAQLVQLRPDMCDIILSTIVASGNVSALFISTLPNQRPTQDAVDTVIEMAARKQDRHRMLKALLKHDFRPSAQALTRIMAHGNLPATVSRLF